MKFVKVNRAVLQELQTQGYNVLISPSEIQDPQNITWQAITVDHVDNWIKSLFTRRSSARPHIMVIGYALTNIYERNLSGSVFIEKNIKTKDDYIEEVGTYGEKMYLRNDAVHTGNWHQYDVFLRREFPESAKGDLLEAQELAARLVQMNKTELGDWIAKNRINMMISDLYFLDEGSILEGTVEMEENLQFIIGDGIEKVVDCPISPDDILTLTDHAVYYVDPIVKN